MKRHLWRELLAATVLLAPLLVLFYPVTFGDRTLFPAENLYQWEPLRSLAREYRVPAPHNSLVSDLVLETLPWKRFLVESLQSGQIPLWNPYTFAGAPFLASGQHSAMYPPSWLFLLLPVERALGFYTLLNLFMAGFFLYLYLRVIGTSRFGAVVGGLTFELSGFLLASVVFPMIVGAAVWLPLVLALVELLLRPVERGEGGGRHLLLWTLLGALALGLQALAGHPEFTYYVLLASGLYALVRAAGVWRSRGEWRGLVRPAAAYAAMVTLGLMLGAAQLVPMFELVTRSFRQQSGSYDEVVAYAYPPRQVATFLLPDFYGNPTHHSYYDLFDRVERALPPDPTGERKNYLWARGERGKNYVESAAYVGILPLLLAGLALWLRRTPQTVALGVLAALSLLFAFGTPLYALLYYLVPGWKQVHTPFRWVFPYTVCLAALAGVGACALDAAREDIRRHTALRLRRLNRTVLGLGLGLLALCAAAVAVPPASLRVADAILRRVPTLQEGFANPNLFASYELRNLAILGLMAALGGAVLFVARRWPRRGWWRPLAAAAVVFDLGLLFHDFNPRSNPAALAVTPPLVRYLQSDPEPHRVTAYRGDKPLIPNLSMLWGIGDARGYDSIVTQQYVEFMGLIEHQGALGFNRISDLYEPRSLDSPLLDLLGVKYVVTPERIDSPKWTLVYDREQRVYRNERALPRAFVVHDWVVEPDHARSDDLLRRPDFDPARLVVLDGIPAVGTAVQPSPAGNGSAVIRRYRLNDVSVEVESDRPGVLVLTDSHFPGWSARVNGEDRPILRADGNFRAVPVPAGTSTVEFRYLPLSVIAGGLTSALSLALIGLGFLTLAWRRLYREGEDGLARRVAKNSATPMLASLYVKGIDVVFAFIVFRLLGPVGVGAYAFAVAINGYQETFNTWGLGTLTMREVARRPEEANRYLGQVMLLRTGLWCAVVPITAILLLGWHLVRGLDGDVALTVALLTLALLPGNFSAAVSGVFQARERMEVPAAVQVVTATLRVIVGLVALMAGLGFVGLAGTALLCNAITAVAFLALMRGAHLSPRFDLPLAQARETLRAAWPLLVNDFLHRAFFRFDVLLLEMLAGSRVLGYYATAYKFIDGMNIIPQSFTYALFPILSRLAADARAPLERTYRLALKYMLLVSIPTAVGTTILAHDIVRLVAGERFLPEAGLALQILIWFLPFSFVNGVTQYVLIAVDEQRAVTRSFALAAPFNILLNLALIPVFGLVAASTLTVLSEVVLLIPFLLTLRHKLTLPSAVSLVWRPLAAALAMGAATWWLQSAGAPLPLTIPAAAAVYAAALLALGAVDATDRALVRQLAGSR